MGIIPVLTSQGGTPVGIFSCFNLSGRHPGGYMPLGILPGTPWWVYTSLYPPWYTLVGIYLPICTSLVHPVGTPCPVHTLYMPCYGRYWARMYTVR